MGPRLTACLVGRLLKSEVGSSNLTNNLIMGQIVLIIEGLGSVRRSAVNMGPTGRVVIQSISTLVVIQSISTGRVVIQSISTLVIRPINT